jgi:hypothetical protein
MSSTYSGNVANNPTSITLPSDGDGPGIKAADVNPAFEGLMDRSLHVADRVADIEALSLDARVTVLEGRRDLVYYQRAAGTLGVNLVEGGPSTTIITTPAGLVTTQLGDIVEVELSAHCTFSYGATPAGIASLNALLRANQNSAGELDIAGSSRSLGTHQITNGSIAGTLHVFGSLVITGAGALEIKSIFQLLGSAGTRSATADTYAYVVRIWRG